MAEIELIAVDPGLNTGWAKFCSGVPKKFGTLRGLEEIFDWIHDQRPNIWVVEDYIIRAGKAAGGYAHQWNRGEALQVIGAIKMQAQAYGADLVLQQPSIKPAAYGWLDMKYVKGKKDMHHMDAIAHGHYYIHKHGIYGAE